MTNNFICKVRYTKAMDNGVYKRVTEQYLVHAHTFSDAEEQIYLNLGDVIKGEFMVNAITKANFHDAFLYDDSDKFFEAKVRYENFDADSEKGKKITQNFLVTANSVEEAYNRIQESLKGLLVDFEIPQVKESAIVEVFERATVLEKEAVE